MEIRIQEIEKRLARIENSSTLDVRTKSVTENIFAWFENHHVLVVTQFQYEMQALGLGNGGKAIRGALYRYAQIGKIRRIERGVYVDNRENVAAVGNNRGYIGRNEPIDFSDVPTKHNIHNSDDSGDSQELRSTRRQNSGLLSVDRG